LFLARKLSLAWYGCVLSFFGYFLWMNMYLHACYMRLIDLSYY
jgi:hypothetical protein